MSVGVPGAPQPGGGAHAPPSMTRSAFRSLVTIHARALLVEQLEGLVERLPRGREGQGVESRDGLPVEVEPTVGAWDRADASDVSVVELDELHRLPRAARVVVVRLEQRLRPGKHVPEQRAEERAEVTFGTRTYPDNRVRSVEYDERRLLLYRDGHGADILRTSSRRVSRNVRSIVGP